MARVFLSYARENSEAAHELAVALDASGHEVWWDHRIHTGSQFGKEIDEALRQSDAVVVLWSRAATESTWVLDEAAEGRDSGKLIPALIEPCKLPLGYRQFHAIDLRKWRDDASVRKALHEAIITLASSSESECRPGPRAKRGERRRRLAQPLSAKNSGATRIKPRPVRTPRLASDAARFAPILAVERTFPGTDSDLATLHQRVEAEVVDRLTRLRWLSVTEQSTLSHSDLPAAVEVRSDYVLHVDASRLKDGFCLTARLSAQISGRTLLLRRFELPEIRGNELADSMRELVAAIDNHVELAEQQRAVGKPLDDLAPDELVWRARWHVDRLTREDAMLAGELVDRLLREAPDWSEALVQAGFVKAWSIWASRGSETQILEVRELGARALAADKFDARAYLLLGMADTWLRQSARARLALEEAITLNPSLCQAYMQLGSALYLAGEAKAALEPMETALRLNPRDTQAFCVLAEHAMAHLMLGDFERAVASADLALLRKPGYWFAHVVKINALIRAGDNRGAGRAYADLLHAKPRFSLRYVDWLPFLEKRWPRALREGIEQAAQLSLVSS